MNFLPDLHVTCEECGGKRFNRQTLEVRFKGKSIGDVLEMRVDESREFFAAVPKVLRGLDAMHEVGLEYLTIGQSSTTLSGGEAQRVKLAAEFGRPSGGRALYILDEPTTGLHFADIDRLLGILHRLVDLGHTVVVIEHHLDVIASADWVIDLGPDAGMPAAGSSPWGPRARSPPPRKAGPDWRSALRRSRGERAESVVTMSHGVMQLGPAHTESRKRCVRRRIAAISLSKASRFPIGIPLPGSPESPFVARCRP